MKLKKMKKRFGHLIVDNFEFPQELKDEEIFINSEIEFAALITLNEHIQRMIGVTNLEFKGTFPDAIANVLEYGDSITIEFEYIASNYNMHKHPFGGCNLIVSFLRGADVRTVRGVPVWSFYKWSFAKKRYVYCLQEDIRFDDVKNEPTWV